MGRSIFQSSVVARRDPCIHWREYMQSCKLRAHLGGREPQGTKGGSPSSMDAKRSSLMGHRALNRGHRAEWSRGGKGSVWYQMGDAQKQSLLDTGQKVPQKPPRAHGAGMGTSVAPAQQLGAGPIHVPRHSALAGMDAGKMSCPRGRQRNVFSPSGAHVHAGVPSCGLWDKHPITPWRQSSWVPFPHYP